MTEVKWQPTPIKDRIRLWAEALESGKYTQVQGQLGIITPGNGAWYCCLGVACEVAMDNGLPLTIHRSPLSGEFPTPPPTWRPPATKSIRYNDISSALPDAVVNWYGFECSDPVLYDPDVDCWLDGVDIGNWPWCITAVNANDNLDWTFSLIAKAIRKHYLETEEGPEEEAEEKAAA